MCKLKLKLKDKDKDKDKDRGGVRWEREYRME